MTTKSTKEEVAVLKDETPQERVMASGLLLVFVVAVVMLAAFVYFVPDELTNGSDLMVAGIVISLVKFSLAVCAMWFILRAMDASARVKFYEAYDRIEESPMALAVYFGARIVAFAILAAGLFQ